MKKFNFKWLLLSIILSIASINTAWADSTVKGGDVYFDAGGSGWSVDNVQYVVGHGSYSTGYNMTAVQNTLLYYYSSPSWNDASYFAFASGTSSWGSESYAWQYRCGSATKSTTEKGSYTLNGSNVYVFKSNGTGTCDGVESDSPYGWLGNSGYSDLNKTITVAAQVSTDGGANYSSASSPGTLTASSYSFTAHGNNCKNSTSLSDGEIICGYTANTTLTAGAATGYTIMGWYDEDGEKLCNNGGTINPREDATVYAYYKLNQYTVSFGVNSSTRNGSITLNSGSAVTTTSSSTLNHGTAIAFTASPSSGYQVEGWYSDAACSAVNKLQSGGNSYDAGTLTAATTVYVKFAEKDGGVITLSAGTGGQVSKDNSSWGSSATITGIKSTTAKNIYAQANTGYTFSSWSKTSGSGTITSTSSASTTFTPVAYEDATVTASFTENSYTITIVGGTAGSTTAKVVTTGSATANPPFGKYFINWTVPESNFSFAGETSATDATITFNATADGTVTANFGQLYAFIQGRMTIYNAARDSKTHVASSEGGWDEGSTRVPMNYDGTNHEFYLSTHMTPAELATEQSSLEQYFFVKTSSDDDNLTDVNIYRPAKGATDAFKKLTAAGTKLSVSKDDGSTHSYWFDSSDDTGYAKLYFNGTQIWYGLEQTLQYNGNGSDGGSAPASKTYYDKGTVVKAASNTFTRTGYTFNGWNTAPGGGGTSYAANADVTLNSNITLYAQWLENEYNTTVEISPDGSGTTSPSAGTVAIKQVTGTAIEATKGTNTVFEDWSVSGGGLTMVSSSTTNPNTFKATSTGGTITANFTSQWTVAGSMYNTWAWDKTSHLLTDYETISTKTYAYVTISDLDPNTSYTLKVKDRNEDQDHGWYGIPNESEDDIYYADGDTYKDVTNETGNQNIVLHTAAAGDYIFKFNVTDKKMAIEYPTSWWITTGVMTEYNDGGSSDATETGGTFTAVDNSSNNVKGGKFVANAASVTFEAGEKDGYTFDAWYTNEGCTTGKTTTNPLTVSSIDADVTRYAKFTENMTTVTLTATNGKIQYWTGSAWADAPSSESVGVQTTCSIKAVPNSGYYFAGWTNTAGSDYSITGSFDSESNNNTTLSGNGGGSKSGQTLTANFVELDKIYFRNVNAGTGEALWDSVYVGFDPNYWGTGTDCSGGPCGADVKGKTAYKMDKIGDTNIWWAYVPRAFTSASKTGIVFFNKGALISHDHFYQGKAAYRADYRRQLDMFIPNRTKKQTYNETDYYDNGYWGVYHLVAEEEVGYYLKNSAGDVDLDQFQATTTGGNTFEATHYINSLSNQYFRISSAGGVPYDANEVTITSSNAETGVVLRDNDAAFTLTPTSEGNYIFRLSQESDALKLTVVYPISPGDYRLKHTYTGRNKANSADSTYITYSDIIKANVAGTSTTYSMYLNDGGTETLVLQECTSIDGETKLPVWSAGDATNLSGVLSKLGTDGNGVYQFDITVNTSTDKVSEVANIKLYDGPFYIKTDCAPGGWLVYTANPMNKNTANPTAFDYYFISWIDVDADKSETKNIKCVIANDYNNAVSDTLKGDGIATIAAGEPVLDQDGSVRFSYNSKTNTLERAYLASASSLTLESSVQYKIYDYSDGTTDQYGRHPGFVDDVVWTYEITVYAKLGAKAGVRADWTNKKGDHHYQTLIANTNKIIDGTGSGTYVIKILFDFKTNTITSTWKPTGEGIEDALTDVDVMLVREGQNASDVITFGTGGSLEPRKLVGSLKFEKDDYWGKVESWTSDTRPLLTFFVSFPFDVKVSDIFGLNSAYGDAYVVRRYAGDERAAKGFFKGDGTTTFWKDLTVDDTMNAYEGYIVVLDNDYFNDDTYSLWGEKDELYLYFPSSKGGTISSGSKTITVPSHPCTIDMTFDGTKNHTNTDSHWNLIGVPVFTTNDDGGSPAEGTPGAIFADTEGDPDAFNYFFEWSSTRNDFSISTAKDYEFKAMHGYMVQYTGEVKFIGSVFVPTPASVAARHTAEKKNYDIELQVLNSDSEMINRTYVALLEGASSEFVLNEDVYLSPNNRAAEIYTFAGDYDVAANRLPIESQSVQVGLNVHKAGTYSITMPSNFSGTATLIDTYNNTRTNLAIEDYEVNLTKGACNDRFILEINLNKMPTAIDGVSGDGSLKDGKAHKFIENGVMYILQNGRIYNAEGALVK